MFYIKQKIKKIIIKKKKNGRKEKGLKVVIGIEESVIFYFAFRLTPIFILVTFISNKREFLKLIYHLNQMKITI